MGWTDPFPGKEFLTASEVRKFLGFTRNDEFKAWVASQAEFPKMVVMGKAVAGNERWRYRKTLILSFVDIFLSDRHVAKPEKREKARKPDGTVETD